MSSEHASGSCSAWVSLLCSLAIAGLFAPAIAAEPEPSAAELIEGLLSGKAPVGGPFELTDHAGRLRTDRIATLDLDHFRSLTTPDGEPFVLLPADAT